MSRVVDGDVMCAHDHISCTPIPSIAQLILPHKLRTEHHKGRFDFWVGLLDAVDDFFQRQVLLQVPFD